MRSRFVLSLVGLCLSVSAALIGCGDDVTVVNPPKVAKSQLGESCGRTDDCDEDLACFNGFCAASQSGDGGSGPIGPGGPVLSAEGESCTKTADCASDLVCISQVCAEGPDTGGGGAGPGPVGPKLGGRGETCGEPADCAEGYTCYASGFLGICDLMNYGIEPNGKMCGECAVDADCCELPASLGYGSCEDLVETYLNGDVATYCPATPAIGYAQYCFEYKTYCSCAANTWKCTNASCQYVATCEASGSTTKGCPSVARGSRPLDPTCDPDSDKCQPPAGGVCDAPADCTGLTIADAAGTCQANECTCFASNCYRKCDEDHDCAAGFICDTADTDLCVVAPRCTVDADCATVINDVRAVCDDGSCKLPCLNDHDCGPSGPPFGAFNGQLCASSGFCERRVCDTDAQCPANPNGYNERQFCVETPAAAGAVPRSAITD